MAPSLALDNRTKLLSPDSQAFVELVNSDAQSALGVCATIWGDNGKIAAQAENKMIASRIVRTRLPVTLPLAPVGAVTCWPPPASGQSRFQVLSLVVISRHWHIHVA